MRKRFGKVRRLPSGNYQASFVAPDGGRINAPITFATEQDVEDWLATQKADLLRRVWKVKESGTQALSGYATEWLKHRQDLKPRTSALYAGLLSRHILPVLGQHQLREITQAEVRRWHLDLGRRTGPTARAQSYRLLRTVLSQAVRDGEIEANPCQIRKAGTVSHVERQPPTLPQIHSLAAEMPARYQVMVLIAAYGGLRFGELTALTREDVHLPDGGVPVIKVRRAMHRLQGHWITGTPKSAAGLRTVALPSFLGPLLEAHLTLYVGERGDALVFGTRTGRPLSSANFGKTWRRIREAQGLDDVHFHDLRHAAATLAVQQGATLKDTMARLGHSTPRAALLYQHSASDRDVMIAKALDAAQPTEVAGQEAVPQQSATPTGTAPRSGKASSRRGPRRPAGRGYLRSHE